ncbi:MAG: HNH endonuclease [Cyanobacteria bacterium J06642_2]
MSIALNCSIVVFSKNYLPLSRINIRKAINLLVLGKAEPLVLEIGDTKSWWVRSPSLHLQVTEYIRLLDVAPERLWKVPAVNRRSVLKRDSYTCQYCGRTSRLTIDHVIPRSRGGVHSWENVVAACEPCNNRKSNRTPEEAGMPLAYPPKAPIHPAVAFAQRFWERQDTSA